MAFCFCVLIPAQHREAIRLGQIILTLGIGLIFQVAESLGGGCISVTFKTLSPS